MPNLSSSSLERIKKELVQRKDFLLHTAQISTQEGEKILEWLEQLAASPFACTLAKNRGLDGAWVVYCQNQNSLLEHLLFRLPALADMQKRHERIKRYLTEQLAGAASLAVYPAEYAEEWAFFAKDPRVQLMGLKDGADFLANQNAFDAIVKNVFLYRADDHLPENVLLTAYLSLKPGGVLINSFWNSEENTAEDPLEKLFFEKLLGMSKKNLHSLSEVQRELRRVGFENITLLPDDANKLYTLVAVKPYEGDFGPAIKRTTAHYPQRKMPKKPCYKKTLFSC